MSGVLDLGQKLKDVDEAALDLVRKCLAVDPQQRQDCKSLLSHRYFDGFRDWFEDELQTLVELDNSEFHVEKSRSKSRDRVEESLRTPRSPVFADKTLKDSPGGRGGDEGTPSFKGSLRN